jgi:hypothetical protein
VIVENTAARVICVADLKLKKPTAGETHDALLPGINEVDEAEWAKAEKIPVVQHMIKEGTLKPQKGKSAADLSQLKAPEAIELVENTVDRELLEGWFANEQRKGVLEAIEAQLEEIAVPAGGKKQE